MFFFTTYIFNCRFVLTSSVDGKSIKDLLISRISSSSQVSSFYFSIYLSIYISIHITCSISSKVIHSFSGLSVGKYLKIFDLTITAFGTFFNIKLSVVDCPLNIIADNVGICGGRIFPKGHVPITPIPIVRFRRRIFPKADYSQGLREPHPWDRCHWEQSL